MNEEINTFSYFTSTRRVFSLYKGKIIGSETIGKSHISTVELF